MEPGNWSPSEAFGDRTKNFLSFHTVSYIVPHELRSRRKVNSLFAATGGGAFLGIFLMEIEVSAHTHTHTANIYIYIYMCVYL